MLRSPFFYADRLVAATDWPAFVGRDGGSRSDGAFVVLMAGPKRGTCLAYGLLLDNVFSLLEV